MNPKISVIITTHANRRERLERAVNSVFAQTYQDFELIVVDDASTDNTREYCESITDPRFVYIHRETNSGLQAIPKNQGTRQAKGEYLAYLDSDNTYRPDHLQILFNEMERNPQIGLVYGDRWLHDEGGNIPDQIGVWGDYNPQALLMRNYIDTSDFLVRKKEIFDIGGWDERYKRMSDWNLLVRLAKNGVMMKRIPVIITDYNLCSDSISHKPENEKQVIGWNPYEVEVDLPYLHDVKDPRVAVFTVIHDDSTLPIVQKCLPELKKKAGYHFYHVIVLNGKLPKTLEWMKEYCPDQILQNDENMGIAYACNQAVDYLKNMEFDVIWKVDGDMLALSDDLLKVMVDLYKKNHMMAWSAYPEGLINNAGGAPRVGYGTLGGHFIGITRHIGGFCQFIPAKARIACRLPDTKVLHFMEDLYMSQEITKLGYGIAYIEDVRVRHILKI